MMFNTDTFDQTFGMGVHNCPGKCEMSFFKYAQIETEQAKKNMDIDLARAILYEILPMLLTTYEFYIQFRRVE